MKPNLFDRYCEINNELLAALSKSVQKDIDDDPVSFYLDISKMEHCLSDKTKKLYNAWKLTLEAMNDIDNAQFIILDSMTGIDKKIEKSIDIHNQRLWAKEHNAHIWHYYPDGADNHCDTFCRKNIPGSPLVSSFNQVQNTNHRFCSECLSQYKLI